MAEFFDVVDEQGKPTGERVERCVAHREDIRHRTAHVWVYRRKEQGFDVLLQKRSMQKDSFPGRYDTSSAGHIQAGEEPLPSAVRELFEELGISASEEELEVAGTFHIHYEKEFHGQMFRDNEFSFVYALEKDLDAASLHVQKEEVESAAWFDLEYVTEQCSLRNQTFCVPRQGLNVLRVYLGLPAREIVSFPEEK